MKCCEKCQGGCIYGCNTYQAEVKHQCEKLGIDDGTEQLTKRRRKWLFKHGFFI